MDVTHFPFLKVARINSWVSILKFGMTNNVFKELRSVTGLQWLPGLGTRNSQLESLTVLSMHDFDSNFWGRFHKASFVFSFLKVKEGGFLTFGKAFLKSCFTKPPLFHLSKDFP